MGTSHIIIETTCKDQSIFNDLPWKYFIENNELFIETNRPESDIVKLIDFMNKKNLTINTIKTKKSTLEEIFIKLTNEK